MWDEFKLSKGIVKAWWGMEIKLWFLLILKIVEISCVNAINSYVSSIKSINYSIYTIFDSYCFFNYESTSIFINFLEVIIKFSL